FVCAFFTYGQPGLNHSSTTVLPLKDERRTSFPSRSFRVKSGAGFPTSARALGSVSTLVCAELGCVVPGALSGAAGGGGSLGLLQATRSRQAARANVRMTRFLGRIAARR